MELSCQAIVSGGGNACGVYKTRIYPEAKFRDVVFESLVADGYTTRFRAYVTSRRASATQKGPKPVICNVKDGRLHGPWRSRCPVG